MPFAFPPESVFAFAGIRSWECLFSNTHTISDSEPFARSDLHRRLGYLMTIREALLAPSLLDMQAIAMQDY